MKVSLEGVPDSLNADWETFIVSVCSVSNALKDIVTAILDEQAALSQGKDASDFNGKVMCFVDLKSKFDDHS
ncbi:hypothetical protein EW145_g5472 [Phellinidium pouzarii]|uniref:Uncharacterized protein n=1 Tax=Phellinidium pouzarii TaxID=167371 RepID=A0A4S4KZU8_9AGAM|nr:hypothetical protein EW145_g5472 [Phellinidium pouzarii]